MIIDLDLPSLIYQQIILYADLLVGFESFCELINSYFIGIFSFFKYIFAFVLFIIGLMTLLKYRGIYRLERLKSKSQKDFEPSFASKMKKSNVLLSMIYFCMAFGILTNFFTYFLIWILNPLPDGFLFLGLNFFQNLNPEVMSSIINLENPLYAHETTIYLIITLISFIALLQIFISLGSIITNTTPSGNPKIVYTLLITGIIEGMIVGFTTCLPFFI